MVCNDRPVYQEEHAAQLIMARRDCSPFEGRIHLRRPVDRPFAFPLQSCGGPYISGRFCREEEGALLKRRPHTKADDRRRSPAGIRPCSPACTAVSTVPCLHTKSCSLGHPRSSRSSSDHPACLAEHRPARFASHHRIPAGSPRRPHTPPPPTHPPPAPSALPP